MKKSSLKKQESHLGFRVSYDGTSFQGFQSQSNSKSIQQWIEKAFSIFFRQEIKIQFTSRTDSGVHAYDQIVVLRNGHSLYSALQLSEQKRLLYSLNALLKGRVCVWKVFRLKADFNPKSDIDWKEYHYQVHQGPVFDPLMTGTAWWIRSSLNLPLMKEALRQLVGHHDFSAFADKKSSTTKKISSEVVDNCRTILNAQVIVTKHPYINEINTIQFRFRGKGFLYRMVRNMVGVVVGIGRGIPWSAETLLQSKKRPQLLVSAPANGLVLAKTQVASGFVSKLLTIFLFLLLFSHSTEAKDFTGSAAFSVSQRFFDDERLGHVNGFSPWGALQLDVSFGLYEFPFGIEPIVGFSYIKNTASLYALDNSGNYVLDSGGNRILSTVDNLSFQFFTGSYGLRYKAWQPDFFWLIPFAEVQQTIRYGRVKKRTFNPDQPKTNSGTDFGYELGGGLLLSFMVDARTRADLKSEMGLKDFCLMSTVRYLPSGFFRKGLGLVDSTGGWDFGLGLFLDW